MTDSSGPEVIDLTGLTESSEEDDEEDDGSESSSSQGGSDDDGDDDEEEVTINELSRARLHDAILTVSESRLRQVLRNLVETIPAVEVALTSELVTLKRKTRDIVSRWEACTNCDQEFDVHEERENEECIFHPGTSFLKRPHIACVNWLLEANLKSMKRASRIGMKTATARKIRHPTEEIIPRISCGLVAKRMD
jgi:hypothetical protein